MSQFFTKWAGALALLGFFGVGCDGPNNSSTESNSNLSPAHHTENDTSANAMVYPKDPHSCSQPNDVVVKHLDLNLNVNFDEKSLRGFAAWTLQQNNPEATHLYLDVSGLHIEKIIWEDGSAAAFTITPSTEVLGAALAITLKPQQKQVRIYYHTDPDAAALQWLDPQQTLGKNLPFLFTQSQAILARTWIPCQDSPGIRFTYQAQIETPPGLMALMSAENPIQQHPKGIYNFSQPIPIPAYLMALTVGDYQFAAVGNRTGVYAEPGILQAAVEEFADMEQMLEAAEKLYGPYVWGRYDLAVMPPSFPFGGMENPVLTFATPTIIAGDRSLVALVAHELAHSWSGNLVTNATWNDFWLNEGFTVYFENRIMEAIYGRDYAEMLAHLSWQDLQTEVQEFMQTRPKDTRLKLDLEGRDPDDGMNTIAYDKGYMLLRLIETTVGRKRFDAFLTNYFESNKFQTMDTERFLTILNDSLLTPAETQQIDVQTWVYQSGLPANCPKPQPSRFEAIDAHLKTLAASQALPPKNETDQWSTHEWLHFINNLPPQTDRSMLAKLDAAYGFTQRNNAEILSAWFNPVIRLQYKPAYPKMEQFLMNVGRRKFLMPAYRSLKSSGQLALARNIYERARGNYHAVSRQSLDALLGTDF